VTTNTVLTAYVDGLKTWMSDSVIADLITPLEPQIAGASGGDDQVLGFFVADWSVRVFAPSVLTRAGNSTEADDLAAIPQITDPSTATVGASDASDAVKIAPFGSWAAKASRAASESAKASSATDAATWAARTARASSCDSLGIDPSKADRDSSKAAPSSSWTPAIQLLNDMIAICTP